MQTPLTIVLICVLLIYIFFILRAVKRKNMRIGYLIFWMITGLLLIVALLIPDLVNTITRLVGFELPINMIFSIAIFIILYLIFDISALISKEENKTTMLIQEISLLKKRVEELETRIKREDK